MFARICTSLLGLAAVAFAADNTVVGDWTLLSFQRFCTYDSGVNACAHSFFIVEKDSAGKSSMPVPCQVTIHNAAGHVPVNQTTWGPVACAGAPVYQLSGGWNDTGFIVYTVINTAENRDAFFGFRDSEIVNNQTVPAITRPAYVVGTFTAAEKLAVMAGL